MKRKFILFVVVLALIFACFVACAPKAESRAERQEQKRLDGILAEINELYIQNDDYKNQWNELEAQQEQLHGSAELNRVKINELWNEYYKDKVDTKVMDKICQLSPDSPMCWNYTMLIDLMDVANKRNVDYKLLLWIMYWESHIWVNFKPYKCSITNNWAGLKARKYDDWAVSEWYNVQYWNLTWMDLEWCWLYYFEDTHTFFESLANTIGIWYAKCNNDPYCIMNSYVWHESAAWINNVYKFYSL